MARKTSKENRKRFDAISQMGCVICMQPPQIHHLKGYEFGTGMGLKAKDEFTIGLCYNHHLGKEGFHQIGKKTWEETYGTQKYWLSVVNEKIKSINALHNAN